MLLAMLLAMLFAIRLLVVTPAVKGVDLVL
jgi:hypothetical protein